MALVSFSWRRVPHLFVYTLVLVAGAQAAFTDCRVTFYSQKEYKGQEVSYEARIQSSPRGTLANAYTTDFLDEIGGTVRSFKLDCKTSPPPYAGYILHKTFMRLYKDWTFTTSKTATEGSYERLPYIAGSWPNWRYYNMDPECDNFKSFAVYFNPWGSLKVQLAFPMDKVVDSDRRRRMMLEMDQVEWKRVEGPLKPFDEDNDEHYFTRRVGGFAFGRRMML